MKGQFFIVATVIMIITLMSLVRYFYSFSGIDLPSIRELSEVEYAPYIKDNFDYVINSFNGDCNKLRADLDYTRKFLESSMIKRGMNLSISYIFDCPPPDIMFDFRIMSSDVLIETNLFQSGTCGDGTCTPADLNCPQDAPSCPEPAVCYLRTCYGGCNAANGPTGDTIASGQRDNDGSNLCNNVQGCSSPPCECDGFGNCVDSSTPPPPP